VILNDLYHRYLPPLHIIQACSCSQCPLVSTRGFPRCFFMNLEYALLKVYYLWRTAHHSSCTCVYALNLSNLRWQTWWIARLSEYGGSIYPTHILLVLLPHIVRPPVMTLQESVVISNAVRNATLACAALVIYEYFLQLDNEVELFWVGSALASQLHRLSTYLYRVL